jgi:hypothetical protein
VSRHGKRRKPKGGGAPEPSRNPPGPDEQRGFWGDAEDEGYGRDAGYPPSEPEWSPRDQAWDRPDDRYSDNQQTWDPYGPSTDPATQDDERGYDPYASGAYRAPDPYERTWYESRDSYESTEHTAAFDPFKDDTPPAPGLDAEPDSEHDAEPAPPPSMSRRDRRLAGSKPAKPAKQAKPGKPAKPARVRRPDPEPLETNDVRVIAIGTALWAIAFAGLYLVRDRLEEEGYGWALWSCLAGFGLGLLGVWYVRNRRDAIMEREPPAARRKPAPTASEPEAEPVREPEPDPERDARAYRGSDTETWSFTEHDDSTPVTGEIVFDDPPSSRYPRSDPPSYRPVDPPSFGRRERLFPPEDGYGRGWNQDDR